MTIRRFTDAIEQALVTHNYYAALALGLTMPDVCGKIQAPTVSSKARYRAWFKKYMQPQYTRVAGGKKHVFLSAEDAYALRCSYLHAGSDSISNQRIRKALTSFHFTEPGSDGGTWHRNQKNSVLQLQVDIFCREMCEAVGRWTQDMASDAGAQDRMTMLLEIHPPPSFL
jgi:hypothetical protein